MDEGPSDEDLARFGDDTGFCPHCGEEVYDDAPACPHCGERLDTVLRRSPVETALQRRLVVIVIVAVLIAFCMAVL